MKFDNMPNSDEYSMNESRNDGGEYVQLKTLERSDIYEIPFPDSNKEIGVEILDRGTEEQELLDWEVPPLSEEDELLVAWFDDDLSTEERVQIEQKIQKSPKLRHKMEELKDTWKMLDTLKTDPASPQLLKSTMEMVALSAQKDAEKSAQNLRYKRILYTAVSVSLVILALLVGHVTATWLLPNPMTQLKKDALFILRLDQLETIGNFEFLMQLKDSGLFNEKISKRIAETSHLSIDKKASPEQFVNLPVPPMDNAPIDNEIIPGRFTEPQRPSMLEEGPNQEEQVVFDSLEWDINNIDNFNEETIKKLLNDSEFHRLYLKYNRLSNKRKAELENCFMQIKESSERNALYQIMDNYYTWIRFELHEKQRDQIMTVDLVQRMAEVLKCMKVYKENLIRENNNRKIRPGEIFQPPKFQDQNNQDNQKNRKSAPNKASSNQPNLDSQYRSNNDNSNKKVFKNRPNEDFQNNSGNDNWSRQNEKRFDSIRQRFPEELQSEKVSNLFSGYFEFRAQKEKEFMEMGVDKTNRWPGMFKIVYDYISSQPIDTFISQLSPKAQEYFKTLQDLDEKKRMYGLLFSVELGEKYGCQEWEADRKMDRIRWEKFNSHWKNNDNSNSPNQFNNNNPLRFTPDGPRAKPSPSQWMNESTKELADTLRKLSQSKQDELLSLPNEEMYARLLMLHWGFDPTKLRMDNRMGDKMENKMMGRPDFRR